MPTDTRTGRPRGERSSDAGVEILYYHPNVRIIAFEAKELAIGASQGNFAPLKSSSGLERTIAAGPFRIYRTPGLVAFLNCGPALQPILPKSQCWCIIEDSSIFILQIRRPNYWRIELPVAAVDDRNLAAELRQTLDKVLQFEKTQCPFERSFSVDLPEPPVEPAKKKPWTPSKPVRDGIVGMSPGAAQTPSPVDLAAAQSLSIDRGLSLTPKSTANRKFLRKASEPILGRGRSHSFEAPAEVPQLNTEVPAGRNDGSPTSTFESSDWMETVVAVNFDTSSLPWAKEPGKVTGRDSVTASNVAPSSDAEPESPKDISPTDRTDDQVQGVPRQVAHFNSISQEENVQERLHDTAVGVAEQHATPAAPRWDTSPHEATEGDSRHEDTRPRLNKSTQGNGGRRHTAQAIAMAPDVDRGTDRNGASDTGEAAQAAHMSEDTSSGSSNVLAVAHQVHEGAGVTGGARKARLRRTAGFNYKLLRSVTSPPELSVDTSLSESKLTDEPALVDTSRPSGEVSPSGSQDSFHSVQSWHSPITPLPLSPPISQPDTPQTFPYPHQNVPRPSTATDESNESDVTPKQVVGKRWETLSGSGSAGSEETTMTASSEIQESKNYASLDLVQSNLRRRRHASSASLRTRGMSPMPPAANIYTPSAEVVGRSPYYQGGLETMRKLPLAIITKTLEMLLGPPSHLIALMLRVAARITAGEWRGEAHGFDEQGKKIPVQWDYSGGEFSDWSDEDGPAFASRGGKRSVKRSVGDTTGSWHIG